MTVLKLTDGSLWIHNPFDLEDADIKTLKSMGLVSGIIAPNVFHGSDLATFRIHFPESKIYVPHKLIRKYPGSVSWSHLPKIAEIQWHPVDGTRIHELLLVHRPSRTMIATDLVFNMPPNSFSGFEKKFMNWNGIDGRFGPSRICKYLFVSQGSAFETSIKKTFTYNFDRVVMNHGEPVSENGKQLWIDSFQSRFGWK